MTATAHERTVTIVNRYGLHARPAARFVQAAAGFDAPDFLAAGPRDVLVPGSLVEEARQVLEDTTGLGSYVP